MGLIHSLPPILSIDYIPVGSYVGSTADVEMPGFILLSIKIRKQREEESQVNLHLRRAYACVRA
eukprot:scaffold26035_cov34-Attheya_sp.AAC.3